MQKINPFGLGGAFLQYCVEREYVVIQEEGKKLLYYVTDEGICALRENFGIELTACMKQN